MIDMRFPTTLQMMLCLALAADEGEALLTSTQLAASVGTNPALVRRLVARLSQASLVAAAKGRDGGVRLTRPAERITLREIYEATFGDEPLWHARENVPHRCVVSRGIGSYFATLTREAEEAMLGPFARRTLADAIAELRQMDRAVATAT